MEKAAKPNSQVQAPHHITSETKEQNSPRENQQKGTLLLEKAKCQIKTSRICRTRSECSAAWNSGNPADCRLPLGEILNETKSMYCFASKETKRSRGKQNTHGASGVQSRADASAQERKKKSEKGKDTHHIKLRTPEHPSSKLEHAKTETAPGNSFHSRA